jgi:hypothetical protein
MDYSKFLESTFPNGKFPVSLEPLFSALGKIVYAWNYVEFYIDSCIVIIWHNYGGNSLPKWKQIPRSLNNKIASLRDALEIDKLAFLQHDGSILMDRIEQLSDKRHKMIHSWFKHANKDSFDFSKFDYKDGHNIIDINFTIDKYLQYGNNMMDRVMELFLFFVCLNSPAKP